MSTMSAMLATPYCVRTRPAAGQRSRPLILTRLGRRGFCSLVSAEFRCEDSEDIKAILEGKGLACIVQVLL